MNCSVSYEKNTTQIGNWKSKFSSPQKVVIFRYFFKHLEKVNLVVKVEAFCAPCALVHILRFLDVVYFLYVYYNVPRSLPNKLFESRRAMFTFLIQLCLERSVNEKLTLQHISGVLTSKASKVCAASISM